MTLKEKVDFYEWVLERICKDSYEEIEKYAREHMPPAHTGGDTNFPYLFGYMSQHIKNSIFSAKDALENCKGK